MSLARCQVLIDQWNEFEKSIKSLEAWIPSALDRVQKLVKVNPAEVETAEVLTKKSALLLVRDVSVVFCVDLLRLCGVQTSKFFSYRDINCSFNLSCRLYG